MKKRFLQLAFNKKGFTLMEIIVVLFVISIGLIGVLTLIVQNIESQSYNKNNLIAYQLAQEGIELVRKTRDSNWRAGQPFNTNLADGDYYMDYLDTVPHLNSNPDLFILSQDTNGFYFHDLSASNPASSFSRQLTINNIDNHTIRIKAHVSWSDRDRNYSYELETLLYDWR